jgi:hypothetical protein
MDIIAAPHGLYTAWLTHLGLKDRSLSQLTRLPGAVVSAELKQELGDTVVDVYGDLVLVAGTAWAANMWYTPVYIAIASIGDAAKKLRAIQRNWSQRPVSGGAFKRSDP